MGVFDVFASTGAFSFLTGPTAYAFLTFNLFSSPCVAALATLSKELRSKKQFVLSLCFFTGLAWVLATAIGVVGRMIVLL